MSLAESEPPRRAEPREDARWARLRPVFDAVADLPAARREPLIQAAALPAEVLAELRSLLTHHDEAAHSDGFMAQAAAQAMAEPRAPASWVGHRLGNWEVVRALGSGGMGEVFEARRADGQYQGRAAVKLVKSGTDNEAVWRRFAQERQALAQLDHPHIARLLDAGLSAEGLPYFVLEYVDGQPIDRAVKPLALRARLRLFLQLTDAVSHAHRQLLVHRDLKPGNVMVDAQGQVKLLDFGIAKALAPGSGAADGGASGAPGGPGRDTMPPAAAARGIDTQTGHRPYTPHYASPEQVRGERVSTGTDIYSLGVLLFELLTGQRPTGRAATTPAEVARAVVEEAPEPPSRLALQPLYLPEASGPAPADPLLLPRAADMWLARSSQQARQARLTEAAQSLGQARQLAERALALRAGDAQAISRLASVEGRLAGVVGGSHGSANLGRVAEARVHADRAVSLLEGLVAREPARSAWQHELGWALNKRYLVAMLEARTADALAAADRGMALADAAAQAEPSSVHLRYQTAVQRMGKARAWSQAGEHARALALQDEAIRTLREAAAADTGNRTVGRYLLLAGMSRGQALVQAGRAVEARPLLAEAVTAMGPAAAGDADGQRLRAEVLVWAARAWREADAPRALDLARRAETLLGPERGQGNAAWRWTLAQAQGEAAAALAALGRADEARAAAAVALATWGHAVPALFNAWLQRDRSLLR